VRDVLAEETTGSIPQVFIIRAGQTVSHQTGHVAEGGLNGAFVASWTSSNALLVKYRAGEWDPHLPATTNFDGITVTFRPD
jgi:hypothetical protein